MRVLFTSITSLRLCFIKVIVLAPSSACFSTTATFLSCIYVFLVTATRAVLRVGMKTLYIQYNLVVCIY